MNKQDGPCTRAHVAAHVDKENASLPVKAFISSFGKYTLLAVFSLPSREGCLLFFIFMLWAVGFMS